MPELPEVQAIVNQLAKKIIGKIFIAAEIRDKKVVNKNFSSFLKNRKIEKISRRGKMIIIELADDKYLLVHLKLTGQLIYLDKDGRATGGGHPIEAADFTLTRPNKFTRLILKFKDGSQLLFHDLRKFGWLKIVDKLEVDKLINQLGIEPLSKEFTIKNFEEILQEHPNLKIKQLLMNQELIAGIGNIYADESLFTAGLRPPRSAKTLTLTEIKKLHSAIIKKLTEAIKFGGTSVKTFIQPDGKKGNFVEKLKVYQRRGKPCFQCGKTLKKIKIAGRGTVYCENCQQ